MVNLNLIKVRLRFAAFQLIETLKVIWKFYRNLAFAKADLKLLSHYFFKNPFRMNRHFLEKRGDEDTYTYGETPLTTLENIANQCHIKKTDTVYELGCGRGRTCFWLNLWLGCHVVGIDHVPDFIKHANQVKKACHLKSIDFIEGNYLKYDLSDATVVYLYGSNLSTQEVNNLTQHLKLLKSGTKVITVSYPLESQEFNMVTSFKSSFGWGEAEVFLSLIKY